LYNADDDSVSHCSVWWSSWQQALTFAMACVSSVDVGDMNGKR